MESHEYSSGSTADASSSSPSSSARATTVRHRPSDASMLSASAWKNASRYTGKSRTYNREENLMTTFVTQYCILFYFISICCILNDNNIFCSRSLLPSLLADGTPPSKQRKKRLKFTPNSPPTLNPHNSQIDTRSTPRSYGNGNGNVALQSSFFTSEKKISKEMITSFISIRQEDLSSIDDADLSHFSFHLLKQSIEEKEPEKIVSRGASTIDHILSASISYCRIKLEQLSSLAIQMILQTLTEQYTECDQESIIDDIIDMITALEVSKMCNIQGFRELKALKERFNDTPGSTQDDHSAVASTRLGASSTDTRGIVTRTPGTDLIAAHTNTTITEEESVHQTAKDGTTAGPWLLTDPESELEFTFSANEATTRCSLTLRHGGGTDEYIAFQMCVRACVRVCVCVCATFPFYFFSLPNSYSNHSLFIE